MGGLFLGAFLWQLTCFWSTATVAVHVRSGVSML